MHEHKGMTEYLKGEQIGAKLEGYVSINIYFLIAEKMIVFPVNDNITYLCRDWIGEFYWGSIRASQNRSKRCFPLSLK